MKRLFRVQRRYDEIICAEDEGDVTDVWSRHVNEIGYQQQDVTELKRGDKLPQEYDDCYCPWGTDETIADVFEAQAQEAWKGRRAVHVITPDDVGEDEGIFACLGHVQEQDVGKVIFRVDAIYQAENDEQRQTRRANVGDREMAKSILLEKLLAKQAEVTRIMEEIAGL